MNKNATTVHIRIDTVYGFIDKYAAIVEQPVDNIETLENYCKNIFNKLENEILKEFKNKEKINRIEDIFK